MVEHPIAPIYDAFSRVLVLGSFPSIRSRETAFYYGHPQNRFWKVIASVFGRPEPKTIEEKRLLLHSSHIALWDVIAACDVKGSADSSIRHAIPTDLSAIFRTADIRCVILNGKTAERYYRANQAKYISCPAVCLPSTSAANAALSLDALIHAWTFLHEVVVGCPKPEI